MSNERGDDFSMRSPRSKCREIQPGWLKIYQSSSPSLSPARNDFSGRAPSFLTALYVHALVTLKCRGSIFARLVQFPITRTLLVLEKARWSLSIAVHSARVIPFRPSFLFFLSLSLSDPRARPLFRRMGIGNVSSVCYYVFSRINIRAECIGRFEEEDNTRRVSRFFLLFFSLFSYKQIDTW